MACILFLLKEQEIKRKKDYKPPASLSTFSAYSAQLSVLEHAYSSLANHRHTFILISVNSRHRCLRQKVKYESAIILVLQ